VYAAGNGEAIAIEVARSPEHEVANIEKCLASGVDQIEVVYLDEAVKDRIESAVREEFGSVPEQVAFLPTSTYV